MIRLLIVIIVIGILLKLNSWEDYRGEGGGLRSLFGGTLIFVGLSYLTLIGLYALVSVI